MRPSELIQARNKPDDAIWSQGIGARPRLEPLSFRHAPALFAALCFCLGAAASRLVWQPPAIWSAAVVLLALLTAFSMRRASWLPLAPLAALWITLGLVSARLTPAPPSQDAVRTYSDGLSRMVRGRIVRVHTLPRPATPDDDTDRLSSGSDENDASSNVSLDLAIEAMEQVTPDTSAMVPLVGGIRATLIGDATTNLLAFRCGDTLEAPMRLRAVERFRDPGAWQYADYLLDQGVAAHATLHSSKLVLTPSASRHWDRVELRCHLFAAQAWAASCLARYTRSSSNRSLPPALQLTMPDAAMLDAMIFGDRTSLTRSLRLGFERTGSFHLFVVSGIHVGLIAWGLFALARRFRLPLPAATLTTIVLTAAYAAVTGFAVPVQRALWMTSIFLLARLLDRARNTLNALGIAVLGVLVWSPRSLFEASFQMSFLAIVAVAGIAIPVAEQTFLPYARATRRLRDTWRDIGFAPRLAEFRILLRLIGDFCKRLVAACFNLQHKIPWVEAIDRRVEAFPAFLVRLSLWLLELVLVALVAEAVMVLPMAIYFHRATLFSLPANVFTIPIVSLLVPSALITFIASLLRPWVAVVPAAITALLLHGITWTIEHIARIQLADLRLPAPAGSICLVSLIAFGFCCWAVRRPRLAWTIAVVLPATAALIVWPQRPLTSPGLLELSVLDVGQGDSLLVVSPNGRTLLVDAGGPIGSRGSATQSATFDVGEEVVAPYLWSRRIRRLDAFVLTHEHSDHMGGAPAILRALRPRELWLGVDVPSVAFSALLAEAASLDIPVRHLRAGDTIVWDQIKLDVLAPESTYGNVAAPRNDDSLVLHVQYGASSILLAGDAEAPEERGMLDHHRISPVTLLKVGHHGSITSTIPAFLAVASPHQAVISVGRGNPFGHPRREVIDRFALKGTPLYRTDMMGLTTFLLSADGTMQTVHPSY